MIEAEVTTLEVIDETGRVYVRDNVDISLSFQDNGRTLKVFVKKREPQPLLKETTV